MPLFLDGDSYDTYAIGAAASVIAALVLWDKQKARGSYPPGPRGYPLLEITSIGRRGRCGRGLLEWPRSTVSRTSLVILEVADGNSVGTDVLHLEVFGAPILVLSRAEPVLELLDKPSAVYSDRVRGRKMWSTVIADAPFLDKVPWPLSCTLPASPPIVIPMGFFSMGAEWPLGFMPYGNRWRTHRRLFHRFFNVSAVDRFDSRLFKGIRDFPGRLADSPEDFADHTRLYATFTPRLNQILEH